MTIVGYSEDYGYQYWIVRNPWISDWGNHGYGYVLRGNNKCGIETEAYGVEVHQVTSDSSSITSSVNSITSDASSITSGASSDDVESSSAVGINTLSNWL